MQKQKHKPLIHQFIIRPILRGLVLVFVMSACSKTYYQRRVESAEKLSEAADELLIATNELRREINQKVEENPNSSSEDFIVLVEQKSQEIERVQQRVEQLAPKRSFEVNQKKNFNKIRAYQQKLSTLSREVNAIYKSFEKELDKKLQSDVYFSTGSANISKAGEAGLKEFVFNDIESIINEWSKEEAYRGNPKKVKIKVVGYADLQGSANVDRRKQNNLTLSEKRAESVQNILDAHLDQLKSKYMLQVDIEHEGKGEESPPGLADVDKIDNPDRRICIISSYVIPVF
jgi:outer membrane protein OmpA-like peptidoglycan-associated protein